MFDRKVAESVSNMTRALQSLVKNNGMEYGSYLQTISVTDAPDFSLIEELDVQITIPLFNLVRDWNDLRALYILYVRGLLPSVPTHVAPLTLDVQAFVDKLEHVIHLGALTVDSQPGLCEGDERQRAYVSCFVNSNDVDISALTQVLKTTPDIIWFLHGDKGVKSNLDKVASKWETVKEGGHVGDRSLYKSKKTTYIPMTVVDSDGKSHVETKLQAGYFSKTKKDDQFEIIAEYTGDVIDTKDIHYLEICHIDFCDTHLLGILEDVLVSTRNSMRKITLGGGSRRCNECGGWK